jgi:tRNA(Ile)-lysidine synthase
MHDARYTINEKIGAAVSGGADSMVMLNMLLQACADVTVVNVEHGLRGQDSQNDSNFVKAFCQKRGIKFLSFCVNAPLFAKENGVSHELAARQLRYNIFETLLKEKTVDLIALGHHKCDQAETVLMRFFRGSGVRGLRGIVDRHGFVHPLLGYSKGEILAYAKEHSVPYVEDKTNCNSDHTRNFLRNELMPLIEKKYPHVKNVLAREAGYFNEIENFLLSEITHAVFNENGFYLPLSVLNRAPAIAKKSVQEALRQFGVEQDIEFCHLDAVLNLKDSANNKRVNLPFGIDAVLEYDKIVFVKIEEKPAFFEIFDHKKSYYFNNLTYSFKKADAVEPFVTFDFDKLPKDAVIRTRQEGDTFKKLGGGTKPLAEFLCDIKMPTRERDKVLVLAKDSVVYLVLGVQVSEQVKVDQNTKNIYKVY